MTSKQRHAALPLTLGLAALALLCGGALLPRSFTVQRPAAAQSQGGGAAAVGDMLTKEWLLDALRARRLSEAEIVRLVEGRGTSFLPDAKDEAELRAAGATDRLLEAVRKNYRRRTQEGGGGPGHTEDPVDYTQPFRQDQVTKRAHVTYKPEAALTDEARRNNAEGVVRLRAVFHSSGRVTDISVVKGMPDGLTESAIAAARRVRFTPAEKDGRQVAQYVTLDYDFAVYVRANEVERRAAILEKPEPEYPYAARSEGAFGTVVLKVALTAEGKVAVVSVEAGMPYGLTEKAVEAARRIKFKPARLKGRAVTQLVNVEYTFGL
jgi:TonB family protein